MSIPSHNGKTNLTHPVQSRVENHLFWVFPRLGSVSQMVLNPFLRAAGFSPSSILPIPNLGEEVLHVDFLTLHLHHPGMLDHAPRRSTAGRLFFKTVCFVSATLRILFENEK